MRILVTGSAGNIGRVLCPYLTEKGHNVLKCDILPGYADDYIMCNINSPVDLFNRCEAFCPEIIIHLAALYGRLANERYPVAAVETNLLGLFHVIELSKVHNANLIFASSSEVYGDQAEDELREDMVSLYPNNRYGLLKLMGEKLIGYEQVEHKLRALMLRFNMAISPSEDFGEYRSAMVRLCEGLSRKQKVDVYSGSKRSWMHINDVCEYIGVFVDQNISSPIPINVAHPEQVDIMDIAIYICNALEISAQDYLDIKPLPPRMTMTKNISISYLNHITDYRPKYSWQQIVDETLENVRRRIG